MFPNPHPTLYNKTIGILGYGHIGAAIAERAVAFGMNVIGTTSPAPAPGKAPEPPLSWLGGPGRADSKRLAQGADFVVVCLPNSFANANFVDADFLAAMKTSAMFLSISDGHVMDEEAVYTALESSSIAGGLIDVWWNHDWQTEGGAPSKYRFDLLDNVLMDPDISSHTLQSKELAITEAAANLAAVADGRQLQNVVRNGSGGNGNGSGGSSKHKWASLRAMKAKTKNKPRPQLLQSAGNNDNHA